MRRLLILIALVVVVVFIAPETRATTERRGYASAYAPGVMAEVVRYRLENGLWRVWPPVDWYTAATYIATNDCAQVGAMVVLVDPGGREYRALVADCGGDDGGAEWMTRNNIIVELDWEMWERLTAVHGRPLEVGLR